MEEHYARMYSILFNSLTDVINVLAQAQQKTEELFLEMEEENKET